MKFQKPSLLLLAIFCSVLAMAQSRAIVEAYINQYKEVAITEMQRTGVPASITLAQGIHETSAGTSDLVLKSNNHFGIKCKSEWAGEKVYHDDDERGECFRKYEDPMLSYRDHSDFLKKRGNYSSLFNLDPTDFEAWAYGLKKAGYATNPKYPQILIKLIQDYNLQDYTLIAMGKKIEEGNAPTWTSTKENIPTEEVVIAAPKEIYPQGAFKINDTKVIYIEKGTSYLKLAEENEVSLSRLFDFNDMKEADIAPKDGLVFLQRKRKAGAHATHTVLPGETLYDIAQTEAIRLESLLQYNFLTANVQVLPGETLYLNVTAPSMPKLQTPKKITVKALYKEPQNSFATVQNDNLFFHTVQPKETMYSIAKKYEVEIDDVKRWNAIETDDLKIGQQIRINKGR